MTAQLMGVVYVSFWSRHFYEVDATEIFLWKEMINLHDDTLLIFGNKKAAYRRLFKLEQITIILFRYVRNQVKYFFE